MKLSRTVGWLLLGLTCWSQAQPLTVELQRADGQFLACKSNLKNIGAALWMWSADHQGHYPITLVELTPRYLKAIPTCPAAGHDTYSETYSGAPANYHFGCGGHFHAQLGQRRNQPSYNSDVRLMQDPLPATFVAAKREFERTPRGALTSCQANLREIGTALEIWAVDHQGRYPSGTGDLVPIYLQTIPTCPAAGHDTYSASLESSGRKGPPDRYAICCQGQYHAAAGVPANRPAYTSDKGLIER